MATNEDLIERVARALLRADHEHADGPTADWDEADPTERIYFLAGAEAAIAAVHEFRNIYGIAALEAAVERARGEGVSASAFDRNRALRIVESKIDDMLNGGGHGQS